ncbi:MAG: TIGR00730 family Rossman fold protein [Leptospiraceae bacterium]|nr:TIGR00730 family Rossman fold protein [Leptospiraceae bacterium]
MIEAFRNLDFMISEEARHLRILADYSYAETIFEKEKIKDTIVIFGSARINPEKKDNKQYKLANYYEDTMEIARLLTEWSISISTNEKQDRLIICTGGGPGIMEAGNRGAKRGGGRSIALNITLPHEQYPNPYVDEKLSFNFHYFFIRKLWFVHLAKAVIAMPGGFGTIDELFETLTLIQTKRAQKKPVVLYGSDFWKKLINFQVLVDNGLIDEEDINLFHFSDSVEDTIQYLKTKISI